MLKMKSSNTTRAYCLFPKNNNIENASSTKQKKTNYIKMSTTA